MLNFYHSRIFQQDQSSSLDSMALPFRPQVSRRLREMLFERNLLCLFQGVYVVLKNIIFPLFHQTQAIKELYQIFQILVTWLIVQDNQQLS